MKKGCDEEGKCPRHVGVKKKRDEGGKPLHVTLD